MRHSLGRGAGILLQDVQNVSIESAHPSRWAEIRPKGKVIAYIVSKISLDYRHACEIWRRTF
jgi:hypothetical protein